MCQQKNVKVNSTVLLILYCVARHPFNQVARDLSFHDTDEETRGVIISEIMKIHKVCKNTRIFNNDNKLNPIHFLINLDSQLVTWNKLKE